MTLFPIVERELRIASRNSRTYWSRFWLGMLSGIGLISVAVVVQTWIPSTQVPRRVFESLIYAGVFYSLFGGLKLTADCISNEKRDGTLGFLFLTDLRGYDVILGKLFGKGILPVYTMMVMIPVLWMLSLVGGVESGELFFGILKILNTLFLSLATGVLVSTLIQDRRRAEFVASIFVLLFYFGAFVLAKSVAAQIPGAVAQLSPNSLIPIFGGSGSLVNRVVFVGGIAGNSAFWISLIIIHLEAWVLIGLASWWVPRCWQERPTKKSQLPFKERLRQWSYGNPETRLARRKSFLEINPFFWLTARNCKRIWISKILIMMTLIIVLASVFLIVLINPMSGPIAQFLTVLLLLTGIFWYISPKFWVATEASRTLSNERQSGSLELLLTTPLTVSEIISGQWQGLRKFYTAAVIFPLCSGVILLAVIIINYSEHWLDNSAYTIALLISLLVMFIADCCTLGWVGMWAGLKYGNVKRASQRAAQLVIFLPTLIFLLIVFPYSALASLNVIDLPMFNFWTAIALWMTIGLVTNFVLIRLSRRLLFNELRSVAQEPLGGTTAEGAWGRQLARRWMKVFGKGKPVANVIHQP